MNGFCNHQEWFIKPGMVDSLAIADVRLGDVGDSRVFVVSVSRVAVGRDVVVGVVSVRVVQRAYFFTCPFKKNKKKNKKKRQSEVKNLEEILFGHAVCANGPAVN